jgi:6-phosphogluconolactonase
MLRLNIRLANTQKITHKECVTALILVAFAVVTLSGLCGETTAQTTKFRQEAKNYFMYVGGYSSPTSKGIYGYRYDANSASFTPLVLSAAVHNPSWIVTDPQHRTLYAVSEIGNAGNENAYISSFSIDAKTGSLTFLNKMDSGGGGACHLVVDKTGKILFVANYGSGSVASFEILPDGSIGKQTGFDQHAGSGIDRVRQKGPHAHSVVLSSDNRFLFVPDLGTDRIMIYKVDAAKKTFTPNDPASASVRAGLGPRHMVFGVGDKFAYVVCEMGSSVAVFSYDRPSGILTPVQTIANLPPDFKGEDNSAEVQVDRTGHFLYASNRGNDSLTIFGIDQSKGTLTKLGLTPSQGKIPRNFAIDPAGRHLLVANQKSDDIVVFAVDQKSGALTLTEGKLNMYSPVCILFVPAS